MIQFSQKTRVEFIGPPLVSELMTQEGNHLAGDVQLPFAGFLSLGIRLQE